LLGVVGVAGLLVWVARAAPPRTNLPTPPAPGRFQLVVASGGYDRVAHVHIPRGYTAGGPVPLVMLLHGGGGSGTHALEKDGWAAKADAGRFVVVAPDGLPAAPKLPASFRTNPIVWNSGQLNPRSPRAAIDDVAFFRKLLDELKARVPHDEARVYCAGHSNGGGMTLRAAAEASERFAAIAMVAGLLAVDNPKPAKPLPTLYILGTKDPLVPMDGGDVTTPWGKRKNPPIAEPLSRWAVAIGCAAEPTTVAEADGVKKVEYPSPTNGPKLTVLYLQGHGHHWPGGRAVLGESVIGPITSRLNATDVMWEFFQRHPPNPSRVLP
jgi:polyhydroxybutyrate depolymerase